MTAASGDGVQKDFSFGKSLGRIVFFVLIAGLLGWGFMYMRQENMIFYPEKLSSDFKYAFPGRFEERTLTVDGAGINALHFKADRSRGAVLYFHGNAGNLASWGELGPDFTERGYDLLIPDYRGFGKSTGRIKNEAMLHSDAAAAYDALKKQFPENQIILYGRSIGTGIAVHLAMQNRPRMVILESPYFSMLDLAAHHYPAIPRLLLAALLRYPMRTDLWIGKVTCPVYLFHGTRDDIIPFDASERLLKLIRSEHELIAVPGGGHNDLSDFPVYQQNLDRILR